MIRCDVYKSLKRENLFLYVRYGEGLKEVPAELLKQFKEPELTLTIELDENRRLAKEDPKLVMANLNEHGYHLQLPPAVNR